MSAGKLLCNMGIHHWSKNKCSRCGKAKPK